MSSKIKKREKLQDRVKELEAENARLRKESEELLQWYQEEYEKTLDFNRTYKGGW